jgi:hypothetical protein
VNIGYFRVGRDGRSQLGLVVSLAVCWGEGR